jgi:hypothetical protein
MGKKVNFAGTQKTGFYERLFKQVDHVPRNSQNEPRKVLKIKNQPISGCQPTDSEPHFIDG